MYFVPDQERIQIIPLGLDNYQPYGMSYGEPYDNYYEPSYNYYSTNIRPPYGYYRPRPYHYRPRPYYHHQYYKHDYPKYHHGKWNDHRDMNCPSGNCQLPPYPWY